MKIKFLVYCFGALVFLTSCSQESFNDETFQYSNFEGKISVTNSVESYILEPFQDGIIKTSYQLESEKKSVDSSVFVVGEKAKDLKYKIKEFEDKLLIKTDKIHVEILKSPFIVNYYNKEFEPILISSKMPTDSSNTKTLYFKTEDSEKFYGMGQKSIPVNRKGYAFDTRNVHIGGYTKPYATMQVNIPYVYSSKNYGVFFDNTYTGYFDLAKNNPEEWSYRTDGGTYTYYVTYGKDLQEVQNAYYDLTGYPTIPPKWTFGLLQSKCGYIDQKEVYEIVSEFENNDLPLDAIILDAYWFGGYGDNYPQNMGNFTWLKEHFPDPKNYMDSLNQKGIKTLTINEPQINVNSENHNYLVEQDWLMKIDNKAYIQESFWAGSASLLDLTNPKAQDWLWQKQKANVELGLDAFWVDLTEPDVSDPKGIFYGGEESKIHNIYSFLFAQTLWDGFQSDYPDKRLFNITRSGTAGMQRFGAVHWSGDVAKTFSGLEMQIPMLIGCAMSGMPHYSSDIGGFTNSWDMITVPWNEYKGGPGITTPELYTRWFQFGVFSPSLRPHSGEDQACEPFAFDKNTLDITSKYLKIRYELIPYLYSYAYKTATSGEQLIKPLFMCFDDENVANRDYEYMFGDLLVAPVYENGATIREVYLPKLQDGLKWVDFWTNKEYESGNLYAIDAPLDKIPVFVKGGSILVTGESKKYVEEKDDSHLTLKIYPGKKNTFELYEDDGTSTQYLKGNYATTQIESARSGKKVEIVIHPIEGDYEGKVKNRKWTIQLYQSNAIDKISLDGQSIDFKSETNNMVEFSFEKETGIESNIKILLSN